MKNKIPGNSIIREFEYLISKYTGFKYCLSVCNASTGILGVVYSLGLSGSEIITTPLTWSGSISGLIALKCKIKFCDVEPKNLTIDPDQIEKHITPETKAVLSADFLGYPARLDKLKQICKKHNLFLIHDAASSFTTKYNYMHTGHYADVTILSFGRKKIFSVGEGGCIVTNNKRIYDLLVKYLMHPERQNTEAMRTNSFALNTNINPLAAKFGIDNFEYFIHLIELRKKEITSKLKKIGINENGIRDDPNYYKIIVSPGSANKFKSKTVLGILPFQKLIFNETQLTNFKNQSKKEYPIAENALNNYRIISKL